MKINLFITCLIAITFANAYAVATQSQSTKKSSINTFHNRYDHQEYLKQQFENQKKAFQLQEKQLNRSQTNDSVTSSIAESKVPEKITFFSKGSYYSNQLASWTKDKINWLKFISAHYLGKVKNLKFKNTEVSVMSVPPSVGNIQFRKLGSGITPITTHYIDSLSDSDGTIVRIKWSFGDGTSVEMFQGEFGPDARVEHIYPQAGHFNLTFEAEDNSGAISTKSTYIEFAENSQPIPYFTATPNPSNPLEVTFNILSKDNDAANINVYTQVCPSGGTTAKTFTCTFPNAGNYNITIWSDDSDKAQVTANSQLTIGGSLVTSTPIGVIDLDHDSGVAPLTVNLDASESFDLDGTVQAYEWDLNDYRNSNTVLKGQKITKTFSLPGTYFIKLKVKDNNQNESTVYKEIHVFANSMTPTPPQIIAFNYSPLKLNFWTDRRAFPISVQNNQVFWDFGDGVKTVGLWPGEHTYANPGTYNVQLKVIDLKGVTQTVSKSITVGAGTDSPNAGWISYNWLIAKPFVNFNYTSNATDPQQSQPLTYQWFYIDGIKDTSGSSVTKQYDTVGYKPVDLIVTNSRGISAFTGNHSEVVSEYNILVPRMTYNPKVGSAPLTVNFNGSGSYSVAGKIVSHQWSINDEVFSTDAIASKTFTTDGTYYLKYIVTDEIGNQGSYDEKIVVNSTTPPSGNAAPNAIISSYFDSSNNRRLNFNCYSSTDDQYVATCSWKLNGVPLLDSRWGVVLLSENINYALELTATDPYGVTTTVVRNYNFTPSPIAIVDFDYIPLKPVAGSNVKFGAEQSLVSGGIASYSWDFGDSTTGSGAIVNHTYANPGTYSVKLTLVSSTNVTSITTKTITIVASAPTAGLKIIARSPSRIGSAEDGETYKSLKFPETVQFITVPTSDAEGVFHDGVWDFGNGQYGYGENVEYTYFKPGTYTVTYTGKTPSNNTVTSSLTVVIPEESSCLKNESQTFCLRLGTSMTNILPLSQTSWSLTHSLGSVNYSTQPQDLTKDWIQLMALDGSEELINIADAVTINNSSLTISREKILEKNVNVNRSYKFKVSTKSDTGNILIGESPEFYFGGAALNITISQSDSKLEIVHPGSQLRQYFDLQGVPIKSLTDLPPGSLTVIAQKGPQKSFRTLNLVNGNITNLNIDLAQQLPRIANRKPLKLAWMNSFRTMANPPSWTQGLCGEASPFMQASVRTLGTGEIIARPFTSVNPEAQSTFVDVNRLTPRNLIVSCAITSPSLMYAQNKWKYKEGPGRCFDNPVAHPLWKTFLGTLNRESSSIVIAYEIKDLWTNEIIKGHYVTSAKDNMLKDELTLDDLTNRIGLGTDNTQDFAQRASFNVKIPMHFRRPQVLFHLISDHSSSNEDYYSVSCDVTDNTVKAVISDIGTPSMNAALNSPEHNARISLTGGYNFFPVQYDNRSTSAIAVVPNVGKVKYTVRIQRHDYKTISWQGVNIDFKYGTQTFSKRYLFTGTAVTNGWERTYTNDIEIDTADLANQFTWQPGVKTMTLVMKPVGKATNNYDTVGETKIFTFTPLFDLQKVKDTNSQICTEGFYQNPISTFVRDELIQNIVASETSGARLRCGDASIPFGGPFELSTTWKYKGHRDGNSINIRSLNQTGQHDNYDDFVTTMLRQNDINEYMNFSTQAKAISLITNEYDVNSQPTAKKVLFDYCHPTANTAVLPCQAETTFSDLDHDMILKICQWNTVNNTMPNGCPSVDSAKILRYSKWVEKNANQLKSMVNQSALKMTISSGSSIALMPPGNPWWQKDSLVYGVWPDAKPIWKANLTGNGFEKTRTATCHENIYGCFQLNPFFQNDNQHFDKILLRTGWN